MRNVKLFIRQPFTQSSAREQSLVAEVLSVIRAQDGKICHLEFLTGAKAQSKATFRKAFEAQMGKPFTPPNFRAWRLSLLRRADAFINIRTAMSESTAFEIATNIFGANNAPMLFLIWDQAEIKTTLIRELDDMADVTYVSFSDPKEVEGPVKAFLSRVASHHNG